MKNYIKLKVISWLFFGVRFTKDDYFKHKESQYQKGFKKYGFYIEDQKDDYADWNIECLQELIDAQVYSEKKKQVKRKRRKVKNIIHFF